MNSKFCKNNDNNNILGMMSDVLEDTDFTLERVHKCLEEGKPIKALGHLLIIANLSARLKAELCPILLSVLGVVSGPLAAEQRYDDLLKCYKEVLDVYSDNEIVLNNIGSQLYRFNHLKESRRYFQLACGLNDSYLPAFRNLQNVTNVLVERWHFRMLNDCRRNETFMKAIKKKVGGGGDQFRTVLDIGTGTGLLSLYVKAAGADYICACDYSSVMTSIAQQVFEANVPPDSIKVVNKLSSDMKVPEDVPFRCSLVVTETMDAGLLGEHLLSTLDHAWDHLLLPPAPNVTRVIPARARLFAAPIESLKIARKNQLLPKSRLNCVPDFQALDWSNLNVRPLKAEPYDTENLYVDLGCKFLSEPVEIFRFDFNDPTDVKRKLQRDVEERIPVLCNTTGCLDAIAVWFEAQLDEDLIITTSPLAENPCTSWHHAIFPCNSFQVANTALNLNCKCSNGVLSVAVAAQSSKKPVISLDVSVIRFLNCTAYSLALQKSVDRLIEKDPSVNRVIDMNIFPQQGLLLSRNIGSKLITINEIPVHLLKKLVKINKINPDLVSRKTFSEVDRDVELELKDKYDLFIVNFVENRGEISQEFLKAAEDAISKFLKPDGVIIPNKTEIWGQLVDSAQLVNENRVKNARLDDEFVLSQFINNYRVSTHLDVCIDEVVHKPLSEPFLIGSIPTRQMYAKKNTTWNVSVPCIRDGTIHAVLYWFNSVLYDDVAHSTRASDSYASQAAEVLDTEIPVSLSDVVSVKCIYNYGVIKLNVSGPSNS